MQHEVEAERIWYLTQSGHKESWSTWPAV
jgi:hypothetical protein